MNAFGTLAFRRGVTGVLLISLFIPLPAQAWRVVAGGGARTFVVPPHVAGGPPPHPMPGPRPPGPHPMPPPPPPPPPPHHSDDWYHPWAAAAVVGATAIAIGTAVASVPKTCVPVLINGISYQQCGSTWYQPQYVGTNVQYVVVVAPR